MANIEKVTTSMDAGIIGDTGLKVSNGRINEEFLTVLKGKNANRVYHEMSLNDSIVGACLFAVSSMLRQSQWFVVARNPEDQKFVESLMTDMDHTWEEFLDEIMSFLAFGWSYFETIYKKREGGEGSDYDDGRIGWKRFGPRGQDSLEGWEFDDHGQTVGMMQKTSHKTVTIPSRKALHFRTNSYKNDPQGRSLLRNAYRSWYFKKRIEEIEGIGIERDLAGLPVAHVPAHLMNADANEGDKAIFNTIQEIVRDVRRDSQEGIVWPLAYDDDGNKLFEFELMTTGGRRQFDTNSIIQRYDQRIAMVFLADFILLGHQRVGSFALSAEKTDIFAVAFEGMLDRIEAVINNQGLKRLWQLNGFPLERLPRIVHGDLEKQDVKNFIENLDTAVSSGLVTFTEDIEAAARKSLELDEFDKTMVRSPDNSSSEEDKDDPDVDPTEPQDS